MKRKNVLAQYLDTLQTQGRYTFTRQEAFAALSSSPDAVRFALLRLLKKNRLMRPVEGFYVIVPTEYQKSGIVPPTWFIDQLMQFHQQTYYVGLLSAAAFYGAAHQAPQVFQVITTKPLRSIHIGRVQIQFLTKKNISPAHHHPMKTHTGYIQVSLPETTAIDLVRYTKSSGHFNHVATVLTELQEEFNKEHFQKILQTEHLEAPDIQRLGYILELVGMKNETVELLKQWVKEKKPRAVALRADKGYDKKNKNLDWRLFINEKIEADEI